MKRPLAAFYGDDFTGSAENLAQFCQRGLRGRLYFSPSNLPSEAEANELDIIGFAGIARALAPDDMVHEVRPALKAIDALNPLIRQYKICSTFDSAPQVGSIGKVMELARQQWPQCALPVLPATPSFGRYTAFSHHFTRYDGEICRLDQNPALANHPSTPMKEADLRRHLAEQTSLTASALTLLDYRALDGGWQQLMTSQTKGGFTILDATDEAEMRHAAELLLRLARQRPMLAIAAQGLAAALGNIWSEQLPKRAVLPRGFAGVDRLLVFSGSCSPQTRRQLTCLEAAGGRVLPLDPRHALNEPHSAIKGMMKAIAEALKTHALVAVATTRMDSDVVDGVESRRLSEALGHLFAQLTHAAVTRLSLRRVVFAGGDTSSHTMRQVGAKALELAAFDATQGGHLCRLIANEPNVSGLEVFLKGGQIGDDDFFVHAWQGRVK